MNDLWHVAFAVGYRILGQPWQAEDIEQSTIERWLQSGPPDAVDPAAYVARIAANLSLNKIRDDKRLSAKHEKFGLPLPVSPDQRADARLDLSYGVATLLMTLPPLMRAVFILRTAFDLPFSEIGDALGCRWSPGIFTCQSSVATRAKQYLTSRG